eukprot:g165.t1
MTAAQSKLEADLKEAAEVQAKQLEEMEAEMKRSQTRFKSQLKQMSEEKKILQEEVESKDQLLEEVSAKSRQSQEVVQTLEDKLQEKQKEIEEMEARLADVEAERDRLLELQNREVFSASTMTDEKVCVDVEIQTQDILPKPAPVTDTPDVCHRETSTHDLEQRENKSDHAEEMKALRMELDKCQSDLNSANKRIQQLEEMQEVHEQAMKDASIVAANAAAIFAADAAKERQANQNPFQENALTSWTEDDIVQQALLEHNGTENDNQTLQRKRTAKKKKLRERRKTHSQETKNQATQTLPRDAQAPTDKHFQVHNDEILSGTPEVTAEMPKRSESKVPSKSSSLAPIGAVQGVSIRELVAQQKVEKLERMAKAQEQYFQNVVEANRDLKMSAELTDKMKKFLGIRASIAKLSAADAMVEVQLRRGFRKLELNARDGKGDLQSVFAWRSKLIKKLDAKNFVTLT